MVIEARPRMLANQIAEKEQDPHDIIYGDAGKNECIANNAILKRS